jgi:hypothetical protein
MSNGIGGSRSTNSRGRPLGAKAQAIREAVLDDLVGRYKRMTVRQVFYSRGRHPTHSAGSDVG